MVAALKEPQVRMGDGSEGAHWYAPGEPPQCAYEILGANGKWRSTNMRDARKYGWHPGVSAITRIPAAYQLERWKRRQTMLSALTFPGLDEIENDEEKFKAVEKDASEQAKKAAERGTSIHKAVETYIQSGAVDPDYLDFISAARAALFELCGTDDRTKWAVETTVTHPHGYGGRIDTRSPSFNIVADFKSKEFSPDEPQGIWPNQGMQLAAYREAAKMPNAVCANIYLSRNHPGHYQVCVWDEKKLVQHWREFCALLRYWQIKNSFPVLARAT